MAVCSGAWVGAAVACCAGWAVAGTEVGAFVGGTGVGGTGVAVGGTGVGGTGVGGSAVGVRVGTVPRKALWLGRAHAVEVTERSTSPAMIAQAKIKRRDIMPPCYPR